MIHGIGLDIVEIERIDQLLVRQPKIIRRVLTEREQQQFMQLGERRRIEFLAGRFAVKEAYAKAFGCGIGRELSFQDIEIEKASSGKPYISHTDYQVHVSITHTKEYAAAQVVIEGTGA
ncbi:4'-phosphopantetheinyl transferase [Jeotgalibacillus alimentarius]|uniref:Holo-[acyl-carrier-protein] synthase n=1 Tax=Jeotgalibacillus alimentarius TaxID=135826 RepID=A0A0C2SEP1_9BACL|nr:holo-ACP synthase [Jeotgalibacillus alimentarius]KIL52414.1 4'-phosphopantetheinyl transferase [Jeotgalibacillus alimentarius]